MQHDAEDSRPQEYQVPGNTESLGHTVRSDTEQHSGLEGHIDQWNSNCEGQVSHIPDTGLLKNFKF